MTIKLFILTYLFFQNLLIRFILRNKKIFIEKFKLYYLWLQENNLFGYKIANINEIDFSNRLEEIFKQDTYKLLINIINNIFNNHLMKIYYLFIEKLSSLSMNEMIKRRKNFIIMEKLLIFRNIFKNKEKNINLIIKRYFYSWKRLTKINPNSSFDKKLKIRKLISKKIHDQDYETRLIKTVFLRLLHSLKIFSNDNKYNTCDSKNINIEINRNSDKNDFIIKINKELKTNTNKNIVNLPSISSNVFFYF